MTADVRLTELEIRYAQLEKTVNDLSEVIYRQQQEIDDLEDQVSMLKSKLQGVDPGLVDGSVQEKPPHY